MNILLTSVLERRHKLTTGWKLCLKSFPCLHLNPQCAQNMDFLYFNDDSDVMMIWGVVGVAMVSPVNLSTDAAQVGVSPLSCSVSGSTTAQDKSR